MDQDEDTRLFLRTLDASTETIFEAFAEMATEFSAMSVSFDTETVHQSTSNRLQQADVPCSQLNTLPSASEESSYYNQPRKKRKRSWTTDQNVLDEPSSVTQTNFSANENTCTFVGWPQTFAFPSYELHQNTGKRGMLPPIAGIAGKCEMKSTEKFDDIPKGLQEAIDIFESLIPSLRKLAIGVETPINQQNADKLELQIGLHKVNWCSRRESTNEASQSKITRNNQISEETRWSSPSTSSGTSARESGYPSSLTGSYLPTHLYSDGSHETGDGYETACQSSSNTGYDTFSDYSSQDLYYLSPSSQGREDRRVEKGRTVGRVNKLWKKIGTIFHHHHHHHHHHYNDRDESDSGGVGLLKRLGNFFHRSGKNDHKREKADKPQKPDNKSVVKKKQHVGHFRTLVDGLMRHTRHSKKPKMVKDKTGILGSGRHKSKRTEKKLTLLQKMGRGKVKPPNKGKVKLKRIATKTAKMILT